MPGGREEIWFHQSHCYHGPVQHPRNVTLRGTPSLAGPPYLTAPAVRPATKLRCNSRKPTTIGTLTTSDAAMIWFQ